MWTFPWIKLSWQTFLLYVEQTWINQLVLSNFSKTGYLLLIWNDFITHMHGLADYVKEGFPFAQDFSLENSEDSYLCFRMALLHSVSQFLFLYGSLSSSLRRVFFSISLNIDEWGSLDQPICKCVCLWRL